MKKSYLFSNILFILFTISSNSQEKSNLLLKLQEVFNKASIEKVNNLKDYTESYKIILDEPIDHHDLSKGTFKHCIYLSHRDFSKPMVIETEGYNARYEKNEVSSLLDANQLIIEYRFYGDSRPSIIPWQYLTNDQAIEDYHQIVEKLKKIYSGKWISTGISKGGETTLIYKSKYPEDIDVAIPYVAPMINGTEDERTIKHYTRLVGTSECRNLIMQMQRQLMLNRTAIELEVASYAKKNNLTFNEVPISEAFEYAVLEFPFSFWQWNGNCDKIPPINSSPKELFDYLNHVVGFDVYSDKGVHRLLPSFYQHFSELGYYSFDLAPVKDLLRIVKSPSNSRFAPRNVDLKYDKSYIKLVRDYAEKKGSKILYIYGGLDPWYACAPTPNEKLDALKMVLPQGTHATRIKHFSKEDQEKMMTTLKKWLQ
ncbi:S28 family serine protease [Flavobacterium columnare]|uniref:S28 family serine protease n=2 Tax=Flavobacterium TaxID=237 RepID=A0ABW8PPG9_9FLAO|nr:S28 family serine protease [Flavobacterium columnare]SPE76461.1 Prolyl tri/tetrapeptidyl aminopeptidase precursor [Flavobacterium columnare]